MKTLQNLNDRTRMFLDEAVAADWTDPQVTVENNLAYHQVITAVISVWEEFYVTTSTFTTVSNQQEYTSANGVPTNIFKIRRLELNYSPSNAGSVGQLCLPINIDSVRQNLTNSATSVSVLNNAAYYLLGSETSPIIGFLPFPAHGGANAAKIWYIPIQSDLVNTSDTVLIPYADRYYHIISLIAAAQLLRKGQQEEAASAKYLQDADIGLERMKNELIDRKASDSKYIVDVLSEVTSFDDYANF